MMIFSTTQKGAGRKSHTYCPMAYISDSQSNLVKFNSALRHAEQRFVFDVEGLRRFAAQSVGRSSDDIVNLPKLAEGGFNRTFLITLRDDFQLVARIPHPATVPKHYAVGSEAATMDPKGQIALPSPPPPARNNVCRSHAVM